MNSKWWPGTALKLTKMISKRLFSANTSTKIDQGKAAEFGARPALMSGSGSAIFGLFASRATRGIARREWFRKEFDEASGSSRLDGEPQPLPCALAAAVGSVARMKEHGRPKTGTHDEIRATEDLHGQRQPGVGGEDLRFAGMHAGRGRGGAIFGRRNPACRSRKTCAAPTFSWCSPPALRWTGT